MSNDLLAFLARWALLHELADDAWRGAVARGREGGAAGMHGGPDAFLDGLAALVAEEKDALRARLTDRPKSAAEPGGTKAALEEILFELGEIRGRLESLETAVGAFDSRPRAERGPDGPARPAGS